jgi:SAM-dependent methyltransferase
MDTYEVAKAIAPGWERQRARIEVGVAPVREWMVRELAPRRGDTILELAAGAGDTGFEAAAIAGPRGRLISTDFSPEMVDVARRRGSELELENVDFRTMDAEQIELDADSVDGVVCRFGYMLMADTEAALAETRRVLSTGGRLVLAVWSAPERNPWITLLAGALVECGLVPPPEPGGPDPFTMAVPEHTERLLAEARFTSVRTEEVPVRFAFSDLDDYIGYATDTAGPWALVLAGLSEPDRDRVAEALREAFTPFAKVDGGYDLPAVALVAVAS